MPPESSIFSGEVGLGAAEPVKVPEIVPACVSKPRPWGSEPIKLKKVGSESLAAAGATIERLTLSDLHEEADVDDDWWASLVPAWRSILYFTAGNGAPGAWMRKSI